MNVVKMITVPKWEWSQEQEWIIDKSSLLNFLELAIAIEGKSYWTETEFCALFPKAPEEGTTKVSVMWEILELNKKQQKSAA